MLGLDEAEAGFGGSMTKEAVGDGVQSTRILRSSHAPRRSVGFLVVKLLAP